MPFYVYILYSLRADKYYVASCQDLDDRLYEHTHSGSKFTKFERLEIDVFGNISNKNGSGHRGNGDQEKEKQEIFRAAHLRSPKIMHAMA